MICKNISKLCKRLLPPLLIVSLLIFASCSKGFKEVSVCELEKSPEKYLNSSVIAKGALASKGALEEDVFLESGGCKIRVLGVKQNNQAKGASVPGIFSEFTKNWYVNNQIITSATYYAIDAGEIR